MALTSKVARCLKAGEPKQRKEVALLAQDQSIARELCRKSRKGISNIYNIQQLTAEKHGLEMQRSTYTQISFTKCLLEYYTIYSWSSNYTVMDGFLTAQGHRP